MSILFGILALIVALAVPIFIITSIVLFIRDGINAKKEGRKRETGFTIMFIISMVIIALILLFTVFLTILSLFVFFVDFSKYLD